MKYIVQTLSVLVLNKDCLIFPNIAPVCFLNEISQNTQGRYLAVEDNHRIFAEECQLNSPWHLERIQKIEPVYDGKSSHDYSEGLAYVLDTWVDIGHPQFENRASRGLNFTSGEHYHGTHVSGLIISKDYGVAKKSHVISIQILNGDGSGDYEMFMRALHHTYEDWVKRGKPFSVINMSVGGPKSQILNKILESLWKEGLTSVVAAGNEGQDSCNTSPASADVIVVGATDRKDKMANFSNRGKCVTLFAPGVDITSLYPHNEYDIISGTSMATPIVTGIVLLNKLGTNEARKKLIDSSLMVKYGRLAHSTIKNQCLESCLLLT